MLNRTHARMVSLADRPWATAFGFLLFGQVVTTLLNFGLTADVLTSLVPHWLILLLSIAYGLGGLLMLVGLAFQRGDYEAAGCVLIASGLVVRGISILVVLGVHPETLGACTFFAVFTWACFERIRQIVHGERIIRVSSKVDLKFVEDEA